jgi:hypothetical protein
MIYHVKHKSSHASCNAGSFVYEAIKKLKYDNHDVE